VVAQLFRGVRQLLYGSHEPFPRRLQGTRRFKFGSENNRRREHCDFGPLDRPTKSITRTFSDIATQLVPFLSKVTTEILMRRRPTNNSKIYLDPRTTSFPISNFYNNLSTQRRLFCARRTKEYVGSFQNSRIRSTFGGSFCGTTEPLRTWRGTDGGHTVVLCSHPRLARRPHPPAYT